MVKARAEAALGYWKTREEAIAPLTEEYTRRLPEDGQATLGKLDFYLLEEILLAFGSGDTNYVVDLSYGFPVTGSIPAGN